jgi:hypothetical protein
MLSEKHYYRPGKYHGPASLTVLGHNVKVCPWKKILVDRPFEHHSVCNSGVFAHIDH